MLRYDSLRGTAAQLANELMRFRELILLTWEGMAARDYDASNTDGAPAAAIALTA